MSLLVKKASFSGLNHSQLMVVESLTNSCQWSPVSLEIKRQADLVRYFLECCRGLKSKRASYFESSYVVITSGEEGAIIFPSYKLLGTGVAKEVFVTKPIKIASCSLQKGGIQLPIQWEEESFRPQFVLAIVNAETDLRKESALREIEILKALNQENNLLSNVVRLNDSGEFDSSHLYMILENCDGGTLETALDHVPCGIKKVKLREACLGLTRLHHLGWAHGDVKPANLGLCRGKIKLLDFGCAESARFPYPQTWTHVRGTPGFFPPRQLKCASLPEETSQMRDVFAFGATMYKVLGGTSIKQDVLDSLSEEEMPLHSFFTNLCWANQNNIFSQIDKKFSSQDDLVALLKSCLILNAQTRLTMQQVLEHPFWKA